VPKPLSSGVRAGENYKVKLRGLRLVKSLYPELHLERGEGERENQYVDARCKIFAGSPSSAGTKKSEERGVPGGVIVKSKRHQEEKA